MHKLSGKKISQQISMNDAIKQEEQLKIYATCLAAATTLRLVNAFAAA
jgi:hypothetical protein